jgi:hypothetical protein
MTVLGTLSSVNLIAGAGILGNVGGVAIQANADLTSNISTYTSVGVVSQFAAIATSGYISINVVANTFPALTNAIPTAYQGSLGTGTMTGEITTQSGNILGSGDLGIFEQIFNASVGYQQQANQFIKSTINATDPNVVTGFTNYDNTITGGFSDITQAFAAFGLDVAQLGSLIDLNNLNNLGSPAALLEQVATLGYPTPGLTTALLNVGISQDAIDNIGTTAFTPAEEKLIYQAMTAVTGTDLAQILKLLRVTTAGISTMADLLNPYKIFPRSYITLTAPTSSGLRGIYTDTAGSVNSNLATTLPENVLVPLEGNPLQNITTSSNINVVGAVQKTLQQSGNASISRTLGVSILPPRINGIFFPNPIEKNRITGYGIGDYPNVTFIQVVLNNGNTVKVTSLMQAKELLDQGQIPLELYDIIVNRGLLK